MKNPNLPTGCFSAVNVPKLGRYQHLGQFRLIYPLIKGIISTNMNLAVLLGYLGAKKIEDA